MTLQRPSSLSVALPFIPRRAFLSRALHLCAYSGLLGPLLACSRDSTLDTYMDPALWADVPKGYVSGADLAAVQDIGATYLKEDGRDRNLETLQAAVNEATTLLAEDMPAATMLLTLQRAIADDFENNTTVSVAGWVLSRTEAQLCALLFLNRGAT